MVKMLRHIIYLKTALWVNSFLFYFKRLWLVGKCAPDSAYSNYGLKKGLSVAALVIRQLIDFAGKPLYLITFIGLPFVLKANKHPEFKGQELLFMTQVLFFLNCVIGGFGDSQIFSVTREKITCIKYMHTDARAYVQGSLVFKYVPFFLYYLPWLMIAAWQMGGKPVQGLLIWFMLLSFRMIGEAVQLFLFDRTGKVISRGMLYGFVLIAVGLAGAYLPPALGWDLAVGALLMHPAAIALYTAAGAFCFWYIIWGYRGYEAKFHRSIDLNFLLSSLLKNSSGSAGAFREVEIKEEDTDISEKEKRRFDSLKGYSYLNALFFARHKRQLIKPVFYRLLMAAVLFAGSVVFFVMNRAAAVIVSKNMTTMLPSFVFIMYFMTVADKASRAMFYNCDKDMLHFAYYRQPRTMLRNFRIRFLRVAFYDLVIAGAVCLAAAGFLLLCGTSVLTQDMLLFCAAILLLAVLFTVHHLCLYYIFQPYSESLQVKNPFFSVINSGMYIVCIICAQIEAGGLLFTMGTLGFTILYMIVALILVYRLAPKNFRVK